MNPVLTRRPLVRAEEGLTPNRSFNGPVDVNILASERTRTDR